MKDLQEIINAKAKARAKKQIMEFIQQIHNQPNLLRVLNDFKATIELDKKIIKNDDLRSIFWSLDNSFGKLLVEKLTEIYIPEESKNFVNKVNKMSKEFDELKNYNYEN